MSTDLWVLLAFYIAVSCIMFGTLMQGDVTKKREATFGLLVVNIVLALCWPAVMLMGLGAHLGRAP